MHDAIVQVPEPINEPVLSYAPGSAEKARLKAALADVEREVVEIPCVVGGEYVKTGRIREVVMPHRHKHVLARFHAAEPDTAERAIRAALEARREWSAMRWEARGILEVKRHPLTQQVDAGLEARVDVRSARTARTLLGEAARRY